VVSGNGGNNYFDNTTVSNWVAGVSTTNKFQSVDTVIFGDLSTANILNTNVTLSGVLYPSVVIVSNTAAPGLTPVYNLIAGSGTIAGKATLLKTNSGTLLLPGNYNYTGPTILAGGTISLATIGNSGLASPLGASSSDPTNLVFNGGTLAGQFSANSLTTDRGATMSTNGGNFDIISGSTLTFSGVFAGPGSLTLSNSDHGLPYGVGGLTLSGANTYIGGTVVSSGTLGLGNTAGAGTGPITFNGGTVNVTAGGTILNNINATTNGGLLTGNATYQINGTITIPTNGVLNVSVIGGGLAGSTNTITFNSNFVASAGSVIRVKDNTTGFMRMLATSGTTNATIDLGNSYVELHTKTPANIMDIGGLMGGQGTSLVGSRSAAGATTWRIGANGSNTVFSGTISNALDSSNGTIGNPTVVNIIKVGTGMLTLAGPCYNNGTFTISNGVLQVNNTGSDVFGNTGGIYGTTMTNGVYDGALSNCPVVICGGTLAGNGTIVSGISNQYGGTLRPGFGNSTPGTVLTVSNLTMLDGSSTVMLVKHSTTPDSLTVNGVLDYGGVLTVNKASGDTAYSIGDNYALFNFSGPNGSYDGISTFATIQPPPGAGLGWQLTPGTGVITVVAATAPTAAFTGSPLSGPYPLTTTFVDGSANANYWVWNFGDGTTLLTGSNTNVPHIYTGAGTFTVTETAYGPGGSAVATHTSYVNVSFPTPVASFAAGPGSITTNIAPMTVTFTNLSTYGTNFIWTFGDGNTIYTNSTANVTNIYATAGVYTVQLMATNPGNYAMAISNNYIVATNLLPPVPVASFTGGPTNVFVSQTVTLTDTSVDTGSGTITNVWNFRTPKPAFGGGSGTGILPVSCRREAAGDFSNLVCRIGQAGSLLHYPAPFPLRHGSSIWTRATYFEGRWRCIGSITTSTFITTPCNGARSPTGTCGAETPTLRPMTSAPGRNMLSFISSTPPKPTG
jgi:fibronectin-binding autotransporter adhesin